MIVLVIAGLFFKTKFRVVQISRILVINLELYKVDSAFVVKSEKENKTTKGTEQTRNEMISSEVFLKSWILEKLGSERLVFYMDSCYYKAKSVND